MPKTNVQYVLKATIFCITFTLLLVVFSLLKNLFPIKFERFTYGVISTLIALLTTYLFLRFDKKSFADIGLYFEKATVPKFFIGVLIGILLMGIMSMSVVKYLDFTIESNPNSSILNFLFWTSPLILLSLMEEIGFRAYPLMLLKQKLPIRAALIITSLLFAVYHIANGWSVIGSFMGPGVCGITFALAAIYSNGISVPTGIHYAFNLTTSAFAADDKSFNLWVLKQKDGLSVENIEPGQLTILLPQISLLIFGIIAMELLLRRKRMHAFEAQ